MSRYEERWTERLERLERRLSSSIGAGEQRYTRPLLWLQCVITSLMISGCFDASLPEFRGDYGVIREELCGDRILTRSEQCDDGNTIDGDGCSSECFVEGSATAGELAGAYAGELAGELGGEAINEGGEVAGEERAGDVIAGDVIAGDVIAGDVIAGDVMGGDEAGEYIEGGDAVIFDFGVEGGTSDEGLPEMDMDVGGTTPDGLLCGDGIIGPGEQCDDGNQETGDGCSAACQYEVAQCEDDVWEPNQDISSASALMAGDSPTPTEAMLCEGDLDIYQVQGCVGGRLEVVADFDIVETDLDLRLTDAEGRLMNSSAVALATEQMVETLLNDDPIYIEVYGYLDEEEGPYTLSVSLSGCGSFREDCGRVGDEDGNGLSDCDDPACAMSPQCSPVTREDCTRLGDEDSNGLADCADPVCANDPLCGGSSREDCARFGDEDGNGLADCADPVCANDPACGGLSSLACSPAEVLIAPGFGVYQGDTFGQPAEDRGTCAGGGNEQVYMWIANQSGEVCLDTLGSDYDTALYVRSECANSSTEVACNDDADIGLQSALSFNAIAGQAYYVFVDGFFGSGLYSLRISPGACGATPPLMEDCLLIGDEDGNGFADCADPVCALRPECLGPPPEDCALFGDEDGNGLADCADPACVNDPACVALGPSACSPAEVLTAPGFGIYQGNTDGEPAEERGTCAGNGHEQVYRFTATQSGAVCVDSAGSSYDTALHVRLDCADASTEQACNDDANGSLQSALSFNAIAGQTYYIFMDGYSSFSGSGPYSLSISPGSCGALPPSFEDCSLFGDEDGNGLADCDDPACINDPACAVLGPTACSPAEMLVAPGFGVYQGSTVGEPAEESGTCAGDGHEQVYMFLANQSGEVCLDAAGSDYDTALHVRLNCADISTEIACNDDAIGLQSALSFNAIAGQTYYIFMDGYGFFGGSGQYSLSITSGPCF